MCHKTAGLVANFLEANDISTIVVGTMQHLLETVPRALVTPHSDAPIGPPGHKERHREVLSKAMEILRFSTQRGGPTRI